MGGLFGGGGSTKVTQTRVIPPAGSQEVSLLSDLYGVARQGYYRPSSEFLQILQEYYQPSREFEQEARNPYLSMLPFQEKVGGLLNQMAQRGVVNSSITQNALNQLGRWTVERGRELRFHGLSALEAARQASLADQLRRVAMREDALRLSKDDRYNKLFRLWNSLYSGRMGTGTTITTQPKQGLFSQIAGEALGMGLGTGLGYWLGEGGGMKAIGGAVKASLNRLFG